MKYEKPQIVDLGSASEAIHATEKGTTGRDAHNCSDPPFATISAYEADE